MTSLALYGSTVASTTLSTANQLATTTGGTETTNTTTSPNDSAAKYMELLSQGGTGTDNTSIPAPDGKGWLLDSTLLEGQTISAGNWSAASNLDSPSGGFAGAHTLTFIIRFYKRSSGGTYTSIGSITITGNNISTSKQLYSFPNTSLSSMAFVTGDKLYVDYFALPAGGGSWTADTIRIYLSNSASAGVANDFQITSPGYTPTTTTSTRTIPATAALLATNTRTIPDSAALLGTSTRTIPDTAALLQTKTRTIPTSAALGASRTIPATAALLGTSTRTIPDTAALLQPNNTRTIPDTAALLQTSTRTISDTAALLQTKTRAISDTAALLQTKTRTIPTTAALTVTSTRTIPTSAALYNPTVFYASNVAATIGGLTQSDQMSMVIGGTETSFTVTSPSSGTNSYVELVSQGGTPAATSALPSPTGKGWSIALQGNTMLAGSWYGTFTLSKSGTSMSTASLIVRWYRRTMDGTCYPIAASILSSQTFSTTKTTYITPSASADLWQFIAGDTLYMDAFVLNGTTAWASDVITVYVSNNATMGVINDGTTTAPELISTPAGLSCYLGLPSFQNGATIPVLNQSFTLADALDQRSVMTLTGEDAAGTLSYTPGQPVMLGDHDQGLLYTGYLASDRASKPAAGNSSAQLEHQMTFADHHRDFDKRANTTNYLNWTAGDMACDFIQQTLSQEGITGAFALESDYTPATFSQGTLTNTVATTTTSPFTYAPNTATPPATSNTGDLELTRAGTQFTLTESATADFSSGTLTNMVASSNKLTPSTWSAVKVVATAPTSYTANTPAANNQAELVLSLCEFTIWDSSHTLGTNDTLHYDVWIASSSPAYNVGVDVYCSDGSNLAFGYPSYGTNFPTHLYTDQNGVSANLNADLTNYAKDTWYSRTISLSSLNGKTINQINLLISGDASGTYTVYFKNIYLGSGYTFFSTTATQTQLWPPATAVGGNYLTEAMTATVVQVYDPNASYRVSPAHSISSTGLVQSSTITWTASLPATGTTAITYPPGSTSLAASTNSSSTPAALISVSYDNITWLLCSNQEALPGLPPGTNVSSLSLYLKEAFQAGNDPSAIPALLQTYISITSAANNPSATSLMTMYGNATEWNTGVLSGAGPNANGYLTLNSVAPVHTWPPITNEPTNSSEFSSITNPTFTVDGSNYRTITATGTNNAFEIAEPWIQFEFAGQLQDFTVDFDWKISTYLNYSGFLYRNAGWNFWTYNYGYCLKITGSQIILTYGSNSSSATASGTVTTVATVTSTANHHYTLVVKGNRHTLYLDHSTTPIIDVFDSGVTSGGGFGMLYSPITSSSNTGSAGLANFALLNNTVGYWTSPSINLSSLGTCGYTQIAWTEMNQSGQQQSTAIMQTSLDSGSTWQACANNAEIPGLTPGTSVSSLLIRAILSGTGVLTPLITGLQATVCGSYGTVTGTRISPALSLSPVGYVASSNVMWNANVPASTSLTVQTTQNLSTYHTVGSSGAGEALTYWTNQPNATQDLFNSNTLANYTNTNKSGGSVASTFYETAFSRISLIGGSGGLYLNNTISCTDVDLLVDMDVSDTGGLVWRETSTSNYYELGVYDASSSGGFTNTLRLYKVSSGTRSLLGSASSIIFTRGTFHRIRVTMQSGLINVYFDGQCKQSYLDTSPLGAGACGMRNDGGTSRYYQLWIQPLGTNLTGQKLQALITMTTSDPSVMPQLFTFVMCVRGPSIATGATISQLHPVTTPFAAYYSSEMDTIVQASGDYYWYVDKWQVLHFGPRLARPGAFPLQSVVDPANSSGYLLYQPQVNVSASADLLRTQQIMTNVIGLVTPPPDVKAADGSATSWTLGYPVYSVPTILVNGQPATIGVQGIDTGRQFYWQPGSSSISYDSALPKLPSGAIISITYVGQSTVNDVLNNTSAQSIQAALEGNSGIIAQIQSVQLGQKNGMTTAQATTFGNGILSRFGNNAPIELTASTLYPGLVPGTVVPLFLPEMLSTWNAQLPIVKVTTTAYQGNNGIIYFYSVDATNGANLSSWQRVFYV